MQRVFAVLVVAAPDMLALQRRPLIERMELDGEGQS